MRSAWQVLTVIVSLLAALGSATTNSEPHTPTPYQPGAWNGGYWTSSLGNDMYSIEVKGNSYTGRGTVVSYAYRRANEVCPAGWDPITSTSDDRTVITSSGESVSGRFFGTPYTNSTVETSTDVKPRVTLIVRCKAPPPCETANCTDLPDELELERN